MILGVAAEQAFTGRAVYPMDEIMSLFAPPLVSQRAPLSTGDISMLVLIGALISTIIIMAIVALLSSDRFRGRRASDREGVRASERESVMVSRQDSVEPLVDALKSTNWEARNEIVSALGNIGGDTVVAPLINVLLHDENAKVRENAACWLGLIGNEKAVPPLMRVVKDYLAGSDTATNVAVASAAALGDIGNPEGLTVVKKLSAALGQSAGPENLKRVSHAVKDIELIKDLTATKCIVCNLPLGNEEELVQCPFCKNIAHKDHMFDWLRGRDYCPACRATISQFSLMAVQPKSPSMRPKRLSTKSKPRSEKKKR